MSVKIVASCKSVVNQSYTMSPQEFMELPPKTLETLTGVHEVAWCRWFMGRVSPKLDKLEEVAIALEMPLGQFVEAFTERRAKHQARAAEMNRALPELVNA